MRGLPFLVHLLSIAVNHNNNGGHNPNNSNNNNNSNSNNNNNNNNNIPYPTATTVTTASNNNDFMSIQGNGVCRVEVAKVEWDPLQPWQRSPQTKSTGTAFVIDGERLLTNAHVVKSATDIRVRPHGSTRRFPARVVCYAPDVDLALLELLGESDRADFFGHDNSNNNNSNNNSNSNSNNTNSNSNSNSSKNTNDNTTTDNTNNADAKRRRITKSLEFATELPALQETVHVVGFPTGGRTICVTEGVVSRIDLYHRIVAIQVDSAINPGNSGGPAFNSKGQVTGVAFRKRISTKSQKVDNIGYLIPAVVVRAFLGRVDREKGTYQLSGMIPYRCHSLENHSLRLAHGVPDSVHGVLITSVADAEEDPLVPGQSGETKTETKTEIKTETETTGQPSEEKGSSSLLSSPSSSSSSSSSSTRLRPGDILTQIDDSPVADDGQVVLRGDELIHHAYLMRVKKKGESVTFTVYRDGKHVVCDPYRPRDIQPIIPRWENVDYMPNYMILGSLVLLPAFLDMRHFKQCGHLLKADCIESYRRWPREWEGKEGLVVLTEIFAHELSFSYSRPWRRVVSYNGEQIKSLRHLQDLWTASCASVVATTTTSSSSSDSAGGADEESTGDASGGNAIVNDDPSTKKTLTFVRLELENDDDIVFEVEAAMKAQEEVMATHAISKPYNILPRNPKYI